jgi:DNA-binding transcriptional regulator of glucitol operon
MSLKTFHIFFIVVSTLLCVVFGVWAIRDFNQSGNWLHMALGVGSFLGSGLLVRYGIWFLRKLKNESYL